MAACYFILLKIYHILIRIVAIFHPKAALMMRGRAQTLKQLRLQDIPKDPCYWFHFASLGEFEQGRSVIEAIRLQEPQTRIVLTFYSPSGFEVRKNTALADQVFYLPSDTPRHARLFIQKLRPKAVFFTKYEYWFGYFRALHRADVPIYMIAAIFRPSQIYFQWYGGFFRNILSYVTHFFTQDQESQKLLQSIGIYASTPSGDTRFDRVVTLPQSRKTHPALSIFAHGKKILVAGSSWPADESILGDWLGSVVGWKLILAPHEINDEHIQACLRLFPDAIRFSQLPLDLDAQQINLLQQSRVLLVDNIGWLSSLYGEGDVAYVGGGFGIGIHNTLEAAAFSIPVLFGPNYQKFREAKDLIAIGGANSIQTSVELSLQMKEWEDDNIRRLAGQVAGTYVQDGAGATNIILRELNQSNSSVVK
jgi:3-deoxy-D-manno-octulosonic-acid transferase